MLTWQRQLRERVLRRRQWSSWVSSCTCFRRQVCVPLCRLRLSMSKQLPDDRQGHALGHEHARVGVSEVVHPETLEPRFLRELPPEPFEVIHRLPGNLAWKQIALPAALLSHLTEPCHRVRAERHKEKSADPVGLIGRQR